jgi:hypothetical protein
MQFGTVRHNDQCRKWRAAVDSELTLNASCMPMGYCSLEQLLRLCLSLPQIEGVCGYGNTIRRTLDFSMHLIDLLIAFNCVS